MAGVYNLTVTNSNGCTSSPVSTSVTVNAKPTIKGETRQVDCTVLPGVNVTAYLGGVAKAWAVSNSTGNYTLQVPEAGNYTVVASKTGFRNETQTILVTGPGTYTLDFVADHGLIPNAPSLAYAQRCVWLYRYGQPPCQLSYAKAMAVVNAWQYPIK
jgi:hypothetical protein